MSRSVYKIVPVIWHGTYVRHKVSSELTNRSFFSVIRTGASQFAIIRRDIKPENILLSPSDLSRITFIDFEQLSAADVGP